MLLEGTDPAQHNETTHARQEELVECSLVLPARRRSLKGNLVTLSSVDVFVTHRPLVIQNTPLKEFSVVPFRPELNECLAQRWHRTARRNTFREGRQGVCIQATRNHWSHGALEH